MKDNVMIALKTVQTCGGERLDPVELQTPGIFGMLNNKYYIRYRESEITGYPDTTTTIKVWKDNVEVTRKGKFQAKFVYRTGERSLFQSSMPYGGGSFVVAVDTSDITYSFSPKGGNLRVDYVMDADNENFVQNSLRVKVTPMGNPHGRGE